MSLAVTFIARLVLHYARLNRLSTRCVTNVSRRVAEFVAWSFVTSIRAEVDAQTVKIQPVTCILYFIVKFARMKRLIAVVPIATYVRYQLTHSVFFTVILAVKIHV